MCDCHVASDACASYTGVAYAGGHQWVTLEGTVSWRQDGKLFNVSNRR